MKDDNKNRLIFIIMEKSNHIYKIIKNKINEINSEISLPQIINKEVVENIHNSSNQIKDILDRLQYEISNLESHSEWEYYTISFIGETNAGKSTIIEALRIKYAEEEKKKLYDKNQELLLEENNLLKKIQEEEEVFNINKESIINTKTKELEIYLQKAEESKKSFLFKIRKFVQKKYEPYNNLVSALKREIESNSNRKFGDLEWVILDKVRLNEIKNQIEYDGEIIGTGRLDYTQTSKTFFIKVNNELVKIIDVPGIEGNEVNYEEEIKKAVSKSHCVFYITSSTKTLESGTLLKVKKYIKDQADIYAIINMRLNSYKDEYYNLSFEEIYKNKLESIGSISQQLRDELKDNFIDVVSINGHWGFLSLSKYLQKEGEKQKLLSDKFKLLNVFQDESVIYVKSNFEKLDEVIFETINQKESKIRKTNILKINTLIEKLIRDLQDNLDLYLNVQFLTDIKEEATIAKKDVNFIFNDFLRDMKGVRIRVLNDFKRKAYESIDSFVQNNKIDENIYSVTIRRILNEQSSLLQENIGSSIKDSTEKVNKQISKNLSKFLDRLDTMSEMNISFSKPNLNLDFDFFKSDLSRLGGALFSVGGLAIAGFSIGAAFGTAIPIPIIGTISGAVVGTVVGAVVGLIKNIFQFFQSTEKKKSKILIKINEQLNEQSNEIDKKLELEFINISEIIKKKAIDENLILIDGLVQMYELRRNKILNTIIGLENVKINE